MMQSLVPQMTEAEVIREPELAHIAGYRVAALDRRGFLELLKQRIRQRRPCWVVTLNLEMLSRGKRDPKYRQLLEGADLFVADGQPIVWGSKMKRGVPRLPERLAGSDLAHDLLRLVPASRLAVIGGKNARAGLQAAGVTNPDEAYVFSERVDATAEQADAFARELAARGSQLLFLALGVPKQDQLAALLRERLSEGVLIGVGGTFEMLEGQVRRAPAWMKKAGMEWLFRLMQEPRRLAHRYLVLYWVGGFALAGDVLKSWFGMDRESRA
jgi:N-acetylglucosaminyldiphosphoundecaprenol N-acetyl-beta-D-mannosaminyltransferase